MLWVFFLPSVIVTATANWTWTGCNLHIFLRLVENCGGPWMDERVLRGHYRLLNSICFRHCNASRSTGRDWHLIEREKVFVIFHSLIAVNVFSCEFWDLAELIPKDPRRKRKTTHFLVHKQSYFGAVQLLPLRTNPHRHDCDPQSQIEWEFMALKSINFQD